MPKTARQERLDNVALAGKAAGANPLSTKGDLWTYSTADAALGVGANNTILMADSAQTTGNKWFDLFGTENEWTTGQNFNAGVFCNSADYTTYADTGSQVNSNYMLDSHTGVLTKQYVGLNVNAAVYPDLTSSPTAVGVICQATWGDAGNYASSMSYIRGGQFSAKMTHPNGTATEVTGGQFITQAESGTAGNLVKVGTAACGVMENQIGYDYHQHTSGFYGITCRKSGAVGTGSWIGQVAGVRIQDYAGVGSTGSNAIRIDSQSGASATKGNVNCLGGGYNNGHLQMENGHVWNEPTANLIKFKGSAPSGATDGIGFIQTQANTNTPSGATAKQLEVQAENGTTYYIPAYSAAW